MIDAYAVYNVGVGRAPCSASLMVKNVLDERYMASRFFFGAPRTIEFTLRAKF